MAIRKNWSLMASRLLILSKCVDRRLWHYEHPLSQFPILRVETVNKLAGLHMSMERLREMSASEIGKGQRITIWTVYSYRIVQNFHGTKFSRKASK